jgi:hypothetical protein
VPCDHHLSRCDELKAAVANYRVTIQDTKRRDRPKKDWLDPAVRQRIEEFDTDCVEDLWIEREKIIERYLDCWGWPDSGGGYETDFNAHRQACIDRLRKAISVFEDDRLLRCNTSVRDQPPEVWKTFWCWDTKTNRPYGLEPGVAYDTRLYRLYVPPPGTLRRR